jgi:hypothetical protein
VAAPLKPTLSARRAFEAQLIVLSLGFSCRPFLAYIISDLRIFLDRSTSTHGWALVWDWNRALNLARDRALALNLARDRALALNLARDRALALNLALAPYRGLIWDMKQKFDNKTDLWQSILATPEFHSFILDLLCDIFTLEPQPQWWEALRVQFLPNIPKRVNLYNESLWHKVEKSFEKEKPGEFEIYFAAWLLIFDAWLYVLEYYTTKDESIFAHLADITREVDVPPLCIAHCIRDLAYGDESRTEDLKVMINSDDPEYRKIFETVYWRPESK